MEQKRGEGKQKFKKGWVQVGSRDGCLKKEGGGRNLLTNYASQSYGIATFQYLQRGPYDTVFVNKIFSSKIFKVAPQHWGQYWNPGYICSLKHFGAIYHTTHPKKTAFNVMVLKFLGIFFSGNTWFYERFDFTAIPLTIQYHTIQCKTIQTTQCNSYNKFIIQFIYPCDSFIQSWNFHERVPERCACKRWIS